jgi:hypothetical protein
LLREKSRSEEKEPKLKYYPLLALIAIFGLGLAESNLNMNLNTALLHPGIFLLSLLVFIPVFTKIPKLFYFLLPVLLLFFLSPTSEAEPMFLKLTQYRAAAFQVLCACLYLLNNYGGSKINHPWSCESSFFRTTTPVAYSMIFKKFSTWYQLALAWGFGLIFQNIAVFEPAMMKLNSLHLSDSIYLSGLFPAALVLTAIATGHHYAGRFSAPEK